MEIEIAIIILGAVVAGFIQGLSGFAFGLVAVSFWAWVLDPRLTASLAVFGALTGQIVSAISIRRKLDWTLLAPFLMGGIVGVPIGVIILPLLDAQIFKAIIGLLLILWCPVMLFSKHIPPLRFGGRPADGLFGLAGGIMGGIGGFAGSIPTLWCALRQFPKEKQRSISQNFSLVTLAVAMAAYILSGTVRWSDVPLFAIVAPALVIPAIIGSRIYIGISEANFRKIILSLLTGSGIALLASALSDLLNRL
jgi:uncharacterized protein